MQTPVHFSRAILLMMALVSLAACTHNERFRHTYAECVSTDPERECRDNAVQRVSTPGGKTPAYTLGIIEFDDQGQLFDRAQMSAVLAAANAETVGADQDSITVVFVHGWKHNASGGDANHPEDDNLAAFRRTLLHLSETEQALSRRQQRAARHVIGVFLAWRGLSISAPVIKELTFWDRKNTAHSVGHGQVTEVLVRLEDIRKTRDAVAGGHSASRLIVVGHSFGGAVVFSALEQILEAHFVSTVGPAGLDSDVDGFGSLVVLINPAFEAVLYSPLSDMSNERPTYFPSQLPVLAIMTSESDWATKKAFKIGRWFATRFEKVRVTPRRNPVTHATEKIDEGATNVTAIGHYLPYRTHFLRATGDPDRAQVLPTADDSAATLKRVSQGWENDAPGSHIDFSGSTLERTTNTASRNPYLVIQVDKELIKDHNDIWRPQVSEFITQLILVSSQSKDAGTRTDERDKL